jgi:hypothetical protein
MSPARSFNRLRIHELTVAVDEKRVKPSHGFEDCNYLQAAHLSLAMSDHADKSTNGLADEAVELPLPHR